MGRILLIIIVFFFAFLPGNAQEYVISLENWGLKEGLSHRQVSQIFKDSRDLIWLATPNGLNRFDGRTFKWYTRENSKLPFNDIAAIHYEDSGRNFLIEQELTHKCALFNPITGNCKFPVDLMGGTEHIAMTDTLKYWKVFPANNEFKSYNGRSFFTTADSIHRYYLYTNGALRQVKFPFATDCLLDDEYYLLINNCRLPDSQYYVYRVNVDGKQLKKLRLPGKVVNYVSNLPEKSALVNVAGHNYYIDSNFQLTDLKSSFKFQYDAFYTGVAGLYFSKGQILRLDGSVIKDFIPDKVGDFSSKQRFYLQEYKAGRVWIANDFGLHLLTVGRNKFKRYFFDSAYNGDGSNSYRAITQVDGKLLVNEEFSGLYQQVAVNTADFRKVYGMIDLDTYGGNENYALCKTAGGSLITAIGRNLLEIDLPGRKYKLLNKGHWLANCWTIFEIQPGLFLLGTEKGLKKLDLRGGKQILSPVHTNEYELQGTFVLHIGKGRDGSIWLCTNTGFYQYSLQQGIVAKYGETESGAHYLPSGSFRHFYEDAQGVFWLATPTGLVRWDRPHHAAKLFTRTEGLSNNSIYAVYADKKGMLWMSSDYGIMHFNPADGRVNTYLTGDGITHNEFNRISHFQDSAGVIYFGSLNGVTAFNPADFDDDKNVNSARLAITDFLQFDGNTNKLVDRTETLLNTLQINIAPNDRFFTLDFALLNYQDPANTVYYSKIEGVDTGWSASKEHSLRLSRLPYGNWTLRIKAQGANGQWSANELSIAINVLKPLYLRTWFLVTLVLLITGAFIVIYRYRLTNLRKKNIKLERAIAARTHELKLSLSQKDGLLGEKEVLLKEIHHRVKNNLQVISALLYLQGNTMEDGKAKSAIVESTGRVKSISLIHQQLYQAHEMSSVELFHFVKELFVQVELLFNIHWYKIRLNNHLPRTRFDIDTAVPLGLLLNELLTNSFKYAFGDSHEGAITITLEEVNPNHFVLTYTDTGPGLPEEKVNVRGKTLGMRMINQLSKQIGGECIYDKESRIFTVKFMNDAGRKMKD